MKFEIEVTRTQCVTVDVEAETPQSAYDTAVLMSNVFDDFWTGDDVKEDTDYIVHVVSYE